MKSRRFGLANVGDDKSHDLLIADKSIPTVISHIRTGLLFFDDMISRLSQIYT